MNIKKVPMMSWNDRFALIDAYNPNDAQIQLAFNLSANELKTARALRVAGTFQPNKGLDTTKYGNIFPVLDDTQLAEMENGLKTTSSLPQTFTKKAALPKTPQKRGRKGDKIATALLNVPSTPVSVESFTQQYGVSVAVLRQSKRFLDNMPQDVVKKIGKIQVKQDKTSKVLMIWREDING